MIAQVLQIAVRTPMSDEDLKAGEEMASQARKADGCEGILSLADPTTGEGLAIHLFRDQIAMDAYDALRQKLTKEPEQDLGVTVNKPHVYEVLVRL